MSVDKEQTVPDMEVYTKCTFNSGAETVGMRRSMLEGRVESGEIIVLCNFI